MKCTAFLWCKLETPEASSLQLRTNTNLLQILLLKIWCLKSERKKALFSYHHLYEARFHKGLLCGSQATENRKLKGFDFTKSTKTLKHSFNSCIVPKHLVGCFILKEQSDIYLSSRHAVVLAFKPESCCCSILCCIWHRVNKVLTGQLVITN